MYPSGVNEIVEHVFIAYIDSQAEPTLSNEHDSWEWCSVDKTLGKMKYPGNIEALKQCATLFDSRLGSKGQGKSHKARRWATILEGLP